jgi:hypothetical protein
MNNTGYVTIGGITKIMVRMKLLDFIKTTEHRSEQLKRGWKLRQSKYLRTMED